MAFKEGWILVDNIPTKALTWGKWITELEPKEKLVLMFTGNPGIAEFYKDFLTELYENLKIPVWIVSHAGHEEPLGPEKKEVINETNKNRLYNLQDQIDHKAAIVRKFVPNDCKVFLIGHSMGSKISLEILKYPDIGEKVEKCFMLFPTVERIADTTNAYYLMPFLTYCGSTLIFLSWIFTLLPTVVRQVLLQITFRLTHGASTECTYRGGMRLVHPGVLKNIFHLTHDEMEKIKELDVETLTKLKKKIKFYYGTTDGWSPLRFYSHLKTEIPDIDAEVCDKGIRHAFTIKSSSIMATMITNWIKEVMREPVENTEKVEKVNGELQ